MYGLVENPAHLSVDLDRRRLGEELFDRFAKRRDEAGVVCRDARLEPGDEPVVPEDLEVRGSETLGVSLRDLADDVSHPADAAGNAAHDVHDAASPAGDPVDDACDQAHDG